MAIVFVAHLVRGRSLATMGSKRKEVDQVIDPQFEDFQRLGTRFALSLKTTDPFAAARAAADFGRRYRTSRDSLPQTDADRAFHLVAKACDLIDYQLPFSNELGAPGLIADAHKQLKEALELDPNCFDARRMLAAAESANPNEYHRYLADHAGEVRSFCEGEREKASSQIEDAEMVELLGELAMMPYLRWIATEAMNSLVCGRYRLCVRLANEAVSLVPNDPSDSRRTLALAYAKLEDQEALDELCAGVEKGAGWAWFALARMSVAFKRGDRAAAEAEVSDLLATYPNAGTMLSRQDDLPDGIFCRICTEPLSEDELIVAVSESTVLLQEGVDPRERGTLGSWLASRPEVIEAAAREVALDPTLREGGSL